MRYAPRSIRNVQDPPTRFLETNTLVEAKRGVRHLMAGHRVTNALRRRYISDEPGPVGPARGRPLERRLLAAGWRTSIAGDPHGLAIAVFRYPVRPR
jgi:hypothetical protein